MKFKLMILSLCGLLGISSLAIAKAYVHSVPAVQGYDVVSYHTEKRPLRGNGHFVTMHDGAVYQFASQENKQRFEADPEKYVPAYGGYCAFGVSVGKKFIGDPEVWRLVDGRLYLNLDARIQAEWNKDIPGRIATADKKWKTIEGTSPFEL